MSIRIPKLFSWAMVAGLALSASAANAALYSFAQTGFDEGATITGTFQTNDADSSGQIDVGNAPLPGFAEMTAFTLSFSGNSIVGAFNHTLSDVSILVYNVGTAYLGDEISGAFQEGIGTNLFGASGFNYASGMGVAGGFGGSVTDIATGDVSYSDELLSVSAVPAPTVFWLLVSAVPGFLRSRRK